MQAAKAYKVLVVEDEGLIAHDIATRLEALGHQVVATVATAEEAVEQAAGRRFARAIMCQWCS
jgi:CheY-like chemotaxis protein